MMTLESAIEKEDFNRRHLPTNGSVFLTHHGLQSFMFEEKRYESGTRDWCLWQIQTVKRLGKMKEERSSDSELSFIAECSLEGSGTAKNVFITAVGRDATELKDFREDLSSFPSAKDQICRDTMAAAKTLS